MRTIDPRVPGDVLYVKQELAAYANDPDYTSRLFDPITIVDFRYGPQRCCSWVRFADGREEIVDDLDLKEGAHDSLPHP